jgi:hypothetical protein
MPEMIIANRLADGAVVFLAAGDTWTTAIDAGLLIGDAGGAERALATAKRHETECVVIDPTVIDVAVESGRRRPTAIREAIRAFGPTVRTDLSDAEPEISPEISR